MSEGGKEAVRADDEVVALLVFGVRSFLYNRYDQQARQSAMADGLDFDPQAYHWVLANTVPRDVFATELESELQREWHSPAALTVMAAGRQMVAAPVLYSNPFVDWMARDARRRLYLNAASRDGNGDVRLCDFQNQHAYLLVQCDFEVRSTSPHIEFRRRDAGNDSHSVNANCAATMASLFKPRARHATTKPSSPATERPMTRSCWSAG